MSFAQEITNSQPKKKRSISFHFRKWLLRFIYSNAYLGVPILALTAESYLYTGSFLFQWNYLGFMFFSTLFVYPFHRLYGVYTTIPIEHTKIQKSVFRRPRLTQVFFGLGLIGSIYFAIQLPKAFIELLMPLALISLTYSLPILPTTNGWKRLRDIPGIKIYVIALVVVLTTSTIPLITQQVDRTDIVYLGLQRLLFIIAITIPFDIRDINLDKKWNLKTIPLLLGTNRALDISTYLLYGSAALVLLQYFHTDLIPFPVMTSSIIAIGFSSFLVQGYKNFKSDLYNAILIEGTMVYHFAFVVIGYLITDLFLG